jgi:hypothetical protein
MPKLLFASIILLLLLGWSCTEENDGQTLIATEEVLFVNGETVRLLGRLISNQSFDASDHGFYISSSNSFASPIIVSLGQKTGPGRFIAEASGLTIGTPYFAKAFATLGGEVIFGETIAIQTLTPAIRSFSPAFSTPGQNVLIEGNNFTSDTKVFFGDQEAEVLQILFDSRIRVRVPPSAGIAKVPVKIRAQNKELTFPELFEYQTGTYTVMPNFPEPIRIYDNSYYQNTQGFFVGLGSVNRLNLNPKIFRFEPTTNQWSDLVFPGTLRAFAFSTPNYVGGGIAELGREPFLINYSFWKINGTAFQRLPDLPFASRQSLAFEAGGSLYVLGGKEGNPSQVRKFNPGSNTWEIKNNAPVSLSSELASFFWNGDFFVVDAQKTLWRYNPVQDTWNAVSQFPGSLGEGSGMGQVIGNRAFVGLYSRSQELWELDLLTMQWKSKNPVPGFPQSLNVGHFSEGGRLYILRVSDFGIGVSFPIEFYRFDPDGI